MSSVGAANRAMFLLAVQGESVHAEVRAPEPFLKLGPQPAGCFTQIARKLVVTQCACQKGSFQASRIRITLHLAKRDRPVGQPSVGVEDRIVRILPALLDETMRRPSVVFDETIAIEISIAIHPFQSTADVRPDG